MKPRKLFGVIALAVICVAVSSTIGFSQNIGVNNPTPDASALLDLTSTNKGFLIPRMTSAQRIAIAGPATGLLVYDTSLGLFYYFNGVVWIPLSGSSVTADNGLSIVPANNVRLGGSSLLMNTEVGLNNFNMAWNGQGSMTIGTNVPASGFLLTLTPNSATWRSGISMTLTNAGSTAYGMDVTTGNSNVNGIRVTHSSSALSSSLYGIGSILSSTNIVSGYLGYRTGSGNTYGVFGITGTNAAYVQGNASTWAGFFEGRTVISGESAPTSALGTDLEVRNTTLGVGNPATIGLRQSTAVTSISSPLGRINFGDNYSATAPQAQILAVRGNLSSSAADVPTDIIFSNTPDGSSVLTERMRILYDGNVGIGTATPAAKLHIMGSLRMVDGTQAAGRVMRSDANGTGSWQTLTASDANAWSLTGNSGTVDGTNFLGTTDNVPLNFKVNNERAGRVEPGVGGETFLGYQAGNGPPSGIRNVGIGYRSLYSATTGYDNTATGYGSLYSTTTGSNNSAIGANALFFNINGGSNTAVGYEAMYFNTSGSINSAFGIQALVNNTSGTYNIALGSRSLFNNSTGGYNTAIGGDMAMYYNTTGWYNTAVGHQALSSNSAGNSATAIGCRALFYANNTATAFTNRNVAVGYEALRGSLTASANTGNYNTAIGFQSLWTNTTGDFNSGFGTISLINNTTGHRNTAIGYAALTNNNIGYRNTAVGVDAMYYNQSGNYNSSIGHVALFSNTSGSYNYAGGYAAMYNNTLGSNNTAIGVNALYQNTSGYQNSAVGYAAMTNNSTGISNAAMGREALYNNLTGNYNTAVGTLSLFSISNEDYNSALGYNAGGYYYSNYGTFAGAYSYPTNTGFTNISGFGYNARPVASNSVRIGNSAVTSIGGYAGWTNLSDARFKMDVNENVKGLEFIMKLRPVTYRLDVDKLAGRLKEDMDRDEQGNITIRTPDESIITSRKEKSQLLQTGFIAQEVEAAAQSVGFDFSGIDKPKNDQDFYGLRYAEFTVPLVKAVQEQQKMIEELKQSLHLLQEENRSLKNRIELLENK